MVAPWKGSGGDLGDPVRWGKTLQWPLRDVLADDFSLVCLVHLLAAAHEEAAICRISMRGQVGPEPGRAFDLGSPPKEPTYPGRWSGIEFAIVDDHSQSDAFELQLTFKREPTEKEREELESDLALWLAVTISGAFAEYPKTPAESFLVADEPKWDDDLTLAWYFEKVRVHEAAFDSLINVCASIDHRLVPISALNFA
jgi:hypothetical protein